MFNENSLSKEERLKLFSTYQEWFDSKGFLVHWDRLEFIKFHWKVDATIENEKGKNTHTFFITPSYLSMWMGFNKPHGVVMRITSDHEPNRFEEMRKAIEQ